MHRPKAIWLMAALVVLVTTGAAYFVIRADRGVNDSMDGREAGLRSEPTTSDSMRTGGEGWSPSPPREQEPDVRNLPKSPVDRPFEFIHELARAAYDGDAEAQYRIAKELDRCETTLLLVRKSNDPEAVIWNLPAGWTQSMRERAFSEYQRCSRLLREDPFAELPKRPGGYTVAYWMSRATESGQPLALVEAAISSLSSTSTQSGESGEPRTQALETLVRATLSGNPDALLLTGFLMRGSLDPERELRGAAWMLAGCRSGADCGSGSAIVPLWMCSDTGDAGCQPGMDVETMLGRALSPAELTKVHSQYEQISAALLARDAEAISAHLGF